MVPIAAFGRNQKPGDSFTPEGQRVMSAALAVHDRHFPMAYAAAA